MRNFYHGFSVSALQSKAYLGRVKLRGVPAGDLAGWLAGGLAKILILAN